MNILELLNLYPGVLQIVEITIEFIMFFWAIKTFEGDKNSRLCDFINNFNSQFYFSGDSELNRLDRKLASFADQVESGLSKEAADKLLAKMFKLDLSCKDESQKYIIPNNEKYGDQGEYSEEFQAMITYLVYLESISPMVLRNDVDFEDVGYLFSYRLFIAMHNPVIQNNDLIPFAEYYRGCIVLYKKWYSYCKKKEIAIPMDRYNIINHPRIKSIH